AEVPVRQRRGSGDVEAVVVVELQFLLGGQVPADTEVGGVLDQGALEGDVEGAVHEFAGFQGDEGVAAEQAGAYRRPLGDTRGVVEVDLVDGSDPVSVAVERLAADQVARVDVGSHGPSTGRTHP